MRKVLSLAVAAIAVVLLAGTTSLGQVQAQSRGLGITPRRDITLEAGKSVTDELTISNLNSNDELSLSLQIIDFGAQDETGTPALRLDPNAVQTAWSLKPFIKAPQNVVIEPGKTKTIKYTVSIPAGQGAGSYYSAIRYSAEGADSGQVAIGASGATLVFVTVPGKTKESLILQKFGAYDIKKDATNGSYRSFFVGSPPKELAYTVKNQGNVAEQPAGSILIKNMFGKQVKVIKDANPKASLALIDQTRRFQVCIDQPDDDKASAEAVDCKKVSLAPGRYTATLNVFYGINGNATQEIITTASFWYLPVWFLIVVTLVLLGLVVAGYLLYRRFTGKGSFKRR
jgi:hypothetical protein